MITRMGLRHLLIACPSDHMPPSEIQEIDDALKILSQLCETFEQEPEDLCEYFISCRKGMLQAREYELAYIKP